MRNTPGAGGWGVCWGCHTISIAVGPAQPPCPQAPAPKYQTLRQPLLFLLLLLLPLATVATPPPSSNPPPSMRGTVSWPKKHRKHWAPKIFL